MIYNSIVEEVHRIRQEILAEYGGDLRLLIADAQRRTEEAERGGQPIHPQGHGRSPQQSKTKKAG